MKGASTITGVLPGLMFGLVVPFAGSQAFAFTGGDGSAADPYQISTCAELQKMQNDLSAHYVLVNDIECNVYPFNTGSGFSPIGTSSTPFTGSLDGRNYKIRNSFKFNLWR